MLCSPPQIGYSALTIAIEQDQKAVALALVQAGANPNLSNQVSALASLSLSQ